MVGVCSMRRSGFEICADLLRVARGGARKTQLVYRANLNFKVVKRYLSVLLGNGLLEVDPPFYSSTEKGEEFLRLFGLIRTCMGEQSGYDGVV